MEQTGECDLQFDIITFAFTNGDPQKLDSKANEVKERMQNTWQMWPIQSWKQEDAEQNLTYMDYFKSNVIDN